MLSTKQFLGKAHLQPSGILAENLIHQIYIKWKKCSADLDRPMSQPAELAVSHIAATV